MHIMDNDLATSLLDFKQIFIHGIKKTFKHQVTWYMDTLIQ